jgi:predicted O-methyltransferase YrrM
MNLIRALLQQSFRKAIGPFTEFVGRDIHFHMQLLAVAETAKYVANNMLTTPAFRNQWQLLDHAISRIQVDGLVLEFGVFKGQTINYIAKRMPSKTIHGFDCFDGLPESWNSEFQKGAFRLDSPPKVEKNVELHVGLFSDSAPQFAAETPGCCALIHVDCDLYSSTVDALSALAPKIVPKTIIVFDEYFNYAGWREGEFKAFQEIVAREGWQYEYIGYVNGPAKSRNMQAAVQIL